MALSNKHIVRLPFFVILQDLERRLVEDLDPLIKENNLNVILTPKRVKDVKNEMSFMRKNRSNLNWVNLLSFNEIVRFAHYFEKVTLTKLDREVICCTRNLICHANRRLVEKHEDVKRLAEAKKICFSMLKAMTA